MHIDLVCDAAFPHKKMKRKFCLPASPCFGITAALVWLLLASVNFQSLGDDAGNQTTAAPVLTTTNGLAAAAGSGSASTPFTETNFTESTPGRVLGPNDVISVKIYQEEDLNTEVTIDMNGLVMLPLLGEVKIGDMTLEQATIRIQELYDKDYLINPHVNLTLEQFAQRRFTVLGEVRAPGSYDFPQNEGVNLLEAIAKAGGFTRLGQASKVMVQRTENNTLKVFRLNADKMATDGKNKPFEILPNDIITVNEKAF
jgi:polysaccharide export outer membrane protein